MNQQNRHEGLLEARQVILPSRGRVIISCSPSEYTDVGKPCRDTLGAFSQGCA